MSTLSLHELLNQLFEAMNQVNEVQQEIYFHEFVVSTSGRPTENIAFLLMLIEKAEQQLQELQHHLKNLKCETK